jgi:predicted nucleic acid-binding protein
MPAFVLDSSVALAWVLPRQQTSRTAALLDQSTEHGALTTGLWPIEVSNVLLVYERRGQMTAAERVNAVGLFAGLDVEFDDQTQERAWGSTYDLALANKLTVYDAGYLELALRAGLPLATLDRDLCRAATKLGVPVLGYSEGE